MLRTDLLDVVNSGQAWAFVGSGASVDAGLPTWAGLVERTLGRLAHDQSSQIRNDRSFKRAREKADYSRCFSIIERNITRATLEAAVCVEINSATSPGNLAQRIADWPFAGYITTNYDSLLEEALARNGNLGWARVGNTELELRKLTGGASNVVWHLHGCTALPAEKSRLILTTSDYDNLYLQHSPVLDVFRSLLGHHRLVFIGFSFQDEEVKRLLRSVGLLASPTRPL
jgi:hypothetical protein